MKATDQLKAEHEGIRVMLRILRVVAKRIEEGRAVPHEDLDAIAEFLSVFIDKCHHGKEEEYLFPALEAAGVAREGGPIGAMLAEHKQGRVLVAALKEAIAALASSRRDAAKQFASGARSYVDLLTRHIKKENEGLFPMAEGRIAPREDDALYEGYEKLERERIGVGRHEQFHALLERLSEAYLG